MMMMTKSSDQFMPANIEQYPAERRNPGRFKHDPAEAIVQGKFPRRVGVPVQEDPLRDLA